MAVSLQYLWGVTCQNSQHRNTIYFKNCVLAPLVKGIELPKCHIKLHGSDGRFRVEYISSSNSMEEQVVGWKKLSLWATESSLVFMSLCSSLKGLHLVLNAYICLCREKGRAEMNTTTCIFNVCWFSLLNIFMVASFTAFFTVNYV